ncbi:NADP-dependent oxidoreductase [Streptomyces netropsis]|uniref:NADPH:quinone reductase-like Zn-dependent oxidoreductase n=1 Tax=Streptomyces netropsis TaxID=55404 RepID=A0A7W7LGW9_STRNE|nr:NADP-dependent oxidoreductase [Streptomyces netropsis]MBB4889466.1 NADPH:quinone reductase-like Zn-dependent oxidoreductase [Streptomyces netropsis]GGR40274.1 oxidoreductase [Streptomyces netropsis]
MKAISYRAYGGPEVLEFGELPEPKVGPDSVLIKVRAAAVNPVDWKAQAGYLDGMLQAVFPVVPGWDVSGVVVGLGADTPEFEIGDEVIGYVREDFLSRGTFAEYVAAPVRTLARKPANLTFEQAAGIPLAGLTAYQALRAAGTGEGDTVLVHAAAGGVGTMAVQLAKHLGARVIGTAGERNHDYLRSLGAEPVTYGDGLAGRVRALAPEGVDVVLDLVGGGTIHTSPEVTAPGARLISIADPDVAALGGRLLWVRPDTADLTALSHLAEQGVLTVEVAEVFPLEKTADAQRLSAEGHTRGKIVVTV